MLRHLATIKMDLLAPLQSHNGIRANLAAAVAAPLYPRGPTGLGAFDASAAAVKLVSK
jgi:hypothetical protein